MDLDLLLSIQEVSNVVRGAGYAFLAYAFWRYARDKHPPGHAACYAVFLALVNSAIIAFSRTALPGLLPYIDIAVTGVTWVAVVRVYADLKNDS